MSKRTLKTFLIVLICVFACFIAINNVFSKQADQLILIKSHNKVGYKDKRGKIIIKPIYDSVQTTPEGLIVIVKNNKLGLTDKNGKIIISPKYKAGLLEYHFHFSEGLAAVIKETKDGYNNCVYIDKTGKEVLDPTKFGFSTVQDGTYGACSEFSEGLAPSTFGQNGEYYGYINNKGKLVISLKNINIDELMCGDALCVLGFENGIAEIAVNGKWKYIDKSGKFISKKEALKKRKVLEE